MSPRVRCGPPPPMRLPCCRCGARLPRDRDAYVLDDEWARRYPGMHGRIACYGCSLGTEWRCRIYDGKPSASKRCEFTPGHIPSPFTAPEGDIDSWSHISPPYTLKAVIRAYPEWAIVQGAEPYLRWLVRRWGGGEPADIVAAVHALQAEWR